MTVISTNLSKSRKVNSIIDIYVWDPTDYTRTKVFIYWVIDSFIVDPPN